MKFRGNSTLFQLRSVALISSEIAFTAAYGRKKTGAQYFRAPVSEPI